MTLRAAPLSLLLAIVLAAPGLAATGGGSGALTLMSRPRGASFRIVGDHEVVGQAPMSLGRGMTGRFEIYADEPGYERWHRTVVLDGVSTDTLWISLRRKNAMMAGGRSLLLPGWGQSYDEHPQRGMMFVVAGLVTGGAAALAEVRYRHRVDDYVAANTAYQEAGTVQTIASAFDARALASERANDAHVLRLVAIGVVGGIWGLSILDAMWAVPKPGGTVLLGAAVGPGTPGHGVGATAALPVAVTLVRVRF